MLWSHLWFIVMFIHERVYLGPQNVMGGWGERNLFLLTLRNFY